MRCGGFFLVCLGPLSAAFAAGMTATPAARLAQSYPEVRLYSRAAAVKTVFGAPASFGVTPEASAAAFVQAHAELFGAQAADLQPGNLRDGQFTEAVMTDPDVGGPKFTLIHYSQFRNGIPVYRSELRLLVRNVPGYPLVLAQSSLKPLGNFVVQAASTRSVGEASARAAAQAAVPGLVHFTPGELVIWAGVEDALAEPRLALAFDGDNGLPATGEYAKWHFVADAATGEILHQESRMLHVDVTGNVSGMATTGPKADLCAPEVITPLPYARVSIGSTVRYTDVNGNFVIPHNGSSPVTVNSSLDGVYFDIQNQAQATTTLAMMVTPPGPANFMYNAPNVGEWDRAEVNAYVQSNIVRDFVLSYAPDYPVIGSQTNFPVNVNINNFCNAYYDYSSINFFRAGGGCANTAFSNVVHHEYGHHLVAVGGSGQGAYGEGMSDCIGLLIADDPVMAYGFNNNCGYGIRTADNEFQYPCSGEIHYCGQLLSGCVWDTRNALAATYPDTYMDILAPLVINSIRLHDGDSIAPDITIAILTLDDDDGSLANGTPHYPEICAGFNAHNMDCPELSGLTFNFPNGRPELVSPAGGTAVRIEVVPLAGTPLPGSGLLYCNVNGGGYQVLPLQPVSGNLYDAVFPAFTCTGDVTWFISVQTTTGQTSYSPANAPLGYYTALSGNSVTAVFDDTFETDQGWTVGAPGDTATAGIWTRNVPQYTGPQPSEDHTSPPGTRCFVTDYRGGALDQYDVDGGRTTLISPAIDLTQPGAYLISYWRWYSNEFGSTPNQDVFRVDVSDDNGATWVNVETIGPSGVGTAGYWLYHEFDPTALVDATSQVRVRFVAEDAGADSVIEAAIDDFRVDRIDCGPVYATGDLNCDGLIGFGDINAFVLAVSNPTGYVNAYPNCDRDLADINGDGTVSFSDINPFVQLLSNP